MKESIEQVRFSHVWQFTLFGEPREIHFTIDQHMYSMSIFKETDRFQHGSIFHEVTDFCPFCKKDKPKWSTCHELDNFRSVLFHRLIEFPSIRLHWLFLDYEERGI